MNVKNIIVFISGEGTNLQEIINKINDGSLINTKIVHVFSSNQSANGNKIANLNSIPLTILNSTRFTNEFNALTEINNLKSNINIDLIILAGWMIILSSQFITDVGVDIINLHPALPGEFPGANAIEKAWKKYEDNKEDSKYKRSGVMVHYVIEEIDAGKVIDKIEVPILDNDTFDDFYNRMRRTEKIVLIQSIEKLLYFKRGKVRNMLELNYYNQLVIHHTNRLSAFDRFITNIPNKGAILCQISKWWFEQTSHIVPNHYIWSPPASNIMIVKKCELIPIEVVVRGYITGSTRTSLWTHYNNGERIYCGIKFPDGLKKNQKLERPVITPTTKDDGELGDSPIDDNYIINKKNILTLNQWISITTIATKLFNFGQMIADKAGLILVDTKYEFGFEILPNGEKQITLIDEIHTPDSSRYWLKETYLEKFNNNEEPDKYDKDVIRIWLKDQSWNPYNLNESVPEIPIDIINKTQDAYLNIFKLLDHDQARWLINYNDKNDNQHKLIQKTVNQYLNNHIDKVIIIAGSISDQHFVNDIELRLKKKYIYSEIYYASAHKEPTKVLEILNKFKNYYGKLIFVTIAGRSNALSGFVAANSNHVVLACPPFADNLDMMININSTLQMPNSVPVLTILDKGNLVLAIDRILNLR
jgi:phosphoribosylaminoimidazole-succinocarboxamide synthase